jgi:hypothetical protein
MVALPYMIVDAKSTGIKDFKKVMPAIRRNLIISMAVFGRAAERMLRKKMRSGKYTVNSPAWKAAKGGTKVLFNTNHFSTAIKSRVIPGAGPVFCSVEVGWLQNTRHPNRQTSGGLQDIVKFLTNNQTWEPSRSSAKAFWAQVPKSWKDSHPPLFKETWYSPKRDFISGTRTSPATIALLHKKVQYAVDRAMKGK